MFKVNDNIHTAGNNSIIYASNTLSVIIDDKPIFQLLQPLLEPVGLLYIH